jgi:hypothetical protein
MNPPNRTSVLPAPLWLLAAVYFAASLAHFGHNAEYIAFYPGMPAWLTRETVYFAWLGVTSIGLLAFAFAKLAFGGLALLLLAVYGAFGLDGLAHYTLALCSEHTLAANITIWSEAVSGLLLLLSSAVLMIRHDRGRARTAGRATAVP